MTRSWTCDVRILRLEFLVGTDDVEDMMVVKEA